MGRKNKMFFAEMRDLTAVATGGAAGAVSRHLFCSAWPAHAAELPWATLAVNIGGSFLLGTIAHSRLGRRPHLFLATGLLSSLTTFSAVAFEISQRTPALALAYAAATLALGISAAWLGAALAGGRNR